MFFEQANADVPVPIGLNIGCQKCTGLQEPHDLYTARIEYFTFETLIPNANGDLRFDKLEFEEDEDWISPDECASMNAEQPQIAKETNMIVDIDELEIVNKQSSFKRKQIIIDQQHDLWRIDDGYIEIYDSKHRIHYKLSGDRCRTYFDQNPPATMNEELLNLVQKSAELSDYHLVGNRIVRDVRTNAYRKITRTIVGRNRLEEIVTLHLKKTQKGLLAKDPVQMRIQNYETVAAGNNINTTKLFNFYSFESIENEQLVDAFDLSNCIDKSKIADFHLAAKKGETITVQ